MRVLWTARGSNQYILKEISPECSLEGLMLKLKLQYFGHLMRRVGSLEKTDAERDWEQEEKKMNLLRMHMNSYSSFNNRNKYIQCI